MTTHQENLWLKFDQIEDAFIAFLREHYQVANSNAHVKIGDLLNDPNKPECVTNDNIGQLCQTAHGVGNVWPGHTINFRRSKNHPSRIFGIATRYVSSGFKLV